MRRGPMRADRQNLRLCGTKPYAPRNPREQQMSPPLIEQDHPNFCPVESSPLQRS
jgi:hypothetical protein